MGEKLIAAFHKAREEGGIVAQVRLAMLTKMTRERALQEPDSPANLRLFEEALVKLRNFTSPTR